MKNNTCLFDYSWLLDPDKAIIVYVLFFSYMQHMVVPEFWADLPRVPQKYQRVRDLHVVRYGSVISIQNRSTVTNPTTDFIRTNNFSQTWLNWSVFQEIALPWRCITLDLL